MRYWTSRRSGTWLPHVILLGFVIVWPLPAAAQDDEAETNYGRFLAIYRQDHPTRSELENALSFLQSANLLAPNTYKYVFSLGALNNTLGNWENAAEWLEKARTLATREEERQAISEELDYCRTQQAKEEIRNWGSAGIVISFIMKRGGVEMAQNKIGTLPAELPVVNTDDSMRPLVDTLTERLDQPFDALENAPFLVIALGGEVSADSHYENGIKDFYRYFMQEYFDQTPRRVVVTVLSPSPFDLEAATNKLYSDSGLHVYGDFLGYYHPADNLIMATGGQVGYGTLLHEMIHALVEADFPGAPAWLNEGLASLYERTRWRSGRLEALPNWRMDQIREEVVPSLRELARKAPTIELHSRGINEIRLLLLYLDQRQQVDDLYNMAKEESFSLESAIAELELNEDDWRAFVSKAFREYRLDMAEQQGALFNPVEVRFVQDALNEILGANLNVDGLWGPSTRAKLIEFQRRFALEPDGIPGPQTMAELKRRLTLTRIDSP